MRKGKVYLIGAGPGDPGLMTLKGKKILEEADCIVYDRLAGNKLLSFVSPGAELIYAGKKPDAHTYKQEEINEILIRKALEGKIVARLKGGDPFLFGRGGEESIALFEHGISFEIVPGITSAIAVPAYGGIPVTHRHYNSSFTIITGHEDPDKENSSLDWKQIASGKDLLVILMGMGRLDKITASLIKYGRPEETPVALITEGTKGTQKTLVSDLRNIAMKAKEENLKPPVIIVIGENVLLREKMNWFETLPLFSKNIVVTRARAQASKLTDLLERYGANVIEFPVIRIKEPESYEDLDFAIENIKDYRWIIFTSQNGVKAFMERLYLKGKDARYTGDIKLCAIGSETAGELRRHGLIADYVPEKFIAEDLVKNFPKFEKGTGILIPRAKEARETIPEEMEKLGASVRLITAYETVIEEEEGFEIKEIIQEKKLDLITFTSSSTVKNFIAKIEKLNIKKSDLNNTKFAAIGPITAKTAQKYGLKVEIMPDEYTIDGLVREIVKYYSATGIMTG